MPNLAMRAFTALVLVSVMPLPTAARADEIRWRVSPATKAAMSRLRIERTSPGERYSNETDIATASLPGLDLARDGQQRFIIRHDAGTLDCSGVVRTRGGNGACHFTSDRNFADALVTAGFARPTDEQNFLLAMVNARLATANALVKFGARPALHDFIALSLHGATPEWLDGLAATGQRGVRANDLIAYRIHGVTGAWLRALIVADPALADASSVSIVAMRIHGVKPDWVQGLAQAGYRNIAASDLIAMRIHGVTPQFAAAAARMRIRPSADELISQRITGRVQ